MMTCPQCSREYWDATLNFCLDDGARLRQAKNEAAKTAVIRTNLLYEFDGFRLDVAEKALFRDGTPLPVTPKCFATLQVLVENAGRLIEKDKLIQAVWPDQFVEEGNLAYTVRLLRKTLGDDPENPKYIQTVPRRGYRFIGECRRVSETNSSEKLRLIESNFRVRFETPPDEELIGREKELAEIAELLVNDRVRLVTLTGPGGTGKTRLAREMVHRSKDAFPAGVLFIDLTAVTDPALVESAIAFQTGIKEFGTKAISDVLADHFRETPALLVLDNFEQVVSAGVQLVKLVQKTSVLKLLVTSREPLKVSIEHEYRVPPLALPSAGTKPTIGDLMCFGAIELFVERAKGARRDLEFSDHDVPALARICRTLDGLPLALELAASRTKVLSVQEILEKLQDRLALLTGGARDVPDRQRTMRATIEWSYGLLSDVEKRVFVLHSVFEGSFNFRAAEKVLTKADNSISQTDVVDAVSSLTEKGLVLSEESKVGDLRFRLLVVVRDYALEVLSGLEERERVKRSHAEYFLDFAEASAPHLFSFRSPEWLDRFELELENVRAAIGFLVDNDPPGAARILAAVRHLAALRLHIREMRRWLEALIEKSAEITPQLRCELQTGLGIICQYQHDFPTAREAHELSLKIGRDLADEKLIARALRGIGAIDYMELDLTAAREHVNEALAKSRSIKDEFGEAAAMARLADVANAEHDYKNARELSLKGLEIFGRLGYKPGIASKLANLTISEFNSGNYEAARQRLVEALEASIEIRDEIDLRINWEVAAALSVEAGDYLTAARLSGRAATLCEEMGYLYEPVEQQFREAYLQKLKTAMSESDFEAALNEGRKMSFADALELAVESARKPALKKKGLRLVRQNARS